MTLLKHPGAGAGMPPHSRGRPVRAIWEFMHSMHFFRTSAGAKMADFCGFGAGKAAPLQKNHEI
ncbi:MAG: hypothetical protein OXH64_06325 [Rhodospirillaceae bacterium]|nr:hypothetical protein [Rhodospirillaceae bacterium]